MKKRFIVIGSIIIFIIIGVYFYICQKDDYIIINKERVLLKDSYIDLQSFHGEGTVSVKNENILGTIKINGRKVGIGQTIELEKIEISNENKIQIEVSKIFQKNKQFTINTLHSQFPEYTVSSTAKEDDGDYYMTTFYKVDKPYFIFKIGAKGEMLYYKRTNEISFDFKKVQINGKTRYMYLTVDKTKPTYANSDSMPCKLVIMNEDYEIIEEVFYQTETDFIGADNHGYIYLEDGHYILASYEKKEVEDYETEDGRKETIVVNNSKVQEIKDGKVLWEWDSIDYPELLKRSYYENKYNVEKPVDFCHFNSMTIDTKDNNLVCSFRNLCAILKIDRQTGKTIWTLGGKGDEFGITQEQQFHFQHSVSYTTDGSLLLYDNGNNENNDMENSKIVKLMLDEENKKILSYQATILKGIYSNSMGSVKEENNGSSYLVCYGAGIITEDIVEEISTQNNEKIFKFNIKDRREMYNVNKCK